MYPNPEIFGITIGWYSTFHWLGVLVAFAFSIWYYSKYKPFNINVAQFAGLMVVLYITLMFGGRLAGFGEAFLKNGTIPNWSLLFAGPAAGQFRWCGSLLLTILLLPVFSKKILRIKQSNNLLDLLAMAFCALTIFTKQGCQFSGDGCYGVVTSLPWGMFYPYGASPNIFPVHPTPIYDSLFHLVFFVFLLWYDGKRKKQSGQTAFIYFVGASIFYILLELIRLNPEVAFGITLPQLVYALIIISSAQYFLQPRSFKIFESPKSIGEKAAEPTWF